MLVRVNVEVSIYLARKAKMYSEHHKILLVGEGDFSFSLCLARRFGSAANMVATTLDWSGFLVLLDDLYLPKLRGNLRELEELGCKILREVDARNMSDHPSIKFERFDRIVFNFPHSGFPCVEHQLSYIRLYQDLVRGFLRNAKQLLAFGGEVHVTHKTTYPYSLWRIQDLGEEEGLTLKSQVPFYLRNYPGYENKRGSGSRADSTFPVGSSSTYIFTH